MRLERLRRAEADLRLCLKANADRVLIDPALALLPLERQLDPVGAVGRPTSADVVLPLLPLLLEDPRRPGVDAEDRRLRLALALTFARSAVRLPELANYASGCAMWDVETAVDRARPAPAGTRDARRPAGPERPGRHSAVRSPAGPGGPRLERHLLLLCR